MRLGSQSHIRRMVTAGEIPVVKLRTRKLIPVYFAEDNFVKPNAAKLFTTQYEAHCSSVLHGFHDWCTRSRQRCRVQKRYLIPPHPRVHSIRSAQKYFPNFHQKVFQ